MEESSCGKTKFGILGVGNIGRRHAQHAVNYGVLAGVCDINQQKAITIGRKYHCSVYYDIDMFLKEGDYDVISVCTPNGYHMRHTIKALNAGYHVLCEKPMALTSMDCEMMMQTAEENNKRLFVVKQNRFNPPVDAVKQAINQGHLGKILSVHVSCFWNRNPEYYNQSTWRGTKKLDGGTLFTQFSHFIDILYWLIGDVEVTHGFTHNYLHHDTVEFEDAGVVTLKFKNDALGTIHYTINSHPRNMEGSITLFGSKGTVKIGGEYLNKLVYQSFDDYEIQLTEKSAGSNDYGSYQGSMSNHDKVYENIVDTLEHNGHVKTNMIHGYKVVSIIEQIYRGSLS